MTVSTATSGPRLAALLVAMDACTWNAAARAQSITTAYAERYSFTDIGSVPGLPDRYGGLTFKPKSANEPNKILIGGNANTSAGEIFEIAVVRGLADTSPASPAQQHSSSTAPSMMVASRLGRATSCSSLAIPKTRSRS